MWGSDSGGRLRVKLQVPKVRKARSQGRGYPNQACGAPHPQTQRSLKPLTCSQTVPRSHPDPGEQKQSNQIGHQRLRSTHLLMICP